MTIEKQIFFNGMVYIIEEEVLVVGWGAAWSTAILGGWRPDGGVASPRPRHHGWHGDRHRL